MSQDRMSFLSTTLLLLSCAIAYKLPLLGGVPLTDGNNPTDKPNNPPFGISSKWEWQSQDRMDDRIFMLARVRREMTDKKHIKKDIKPNAKMLPKVKSTEPPLKEPSDSTPYILEASSGALTKAKSMPLLNEDETTPLTDLEQTTKAAGQTLDEDETTPLTDLEQTTKAAGQTLDEDETTPLTDLEHTTKASGQTLSEDETTKGDVKPDEKIRPKVKPTEPPLKEPSDSTPYILEASSGAFTKAESMPLLSEDETTPLTDLEHTTKASGQTLNEDETSKGDVKPDEKIRPKVKPTEPPLEELSDTTPYILEASSAALTKANSMSTLSEDGTTPLTDLKRTTSRSGETLDEDETTHVEKSVTQSSELTLHSTTSEELSVLTSNKYNKATTVKQVHFTSNQQTSTNAKLLEDITSSLSPKAAETSPVIPPDQTTGHDVTTVWVLASSGYSSKPADVTLITTSSEDKVQIQSIMKQCMITILILAVICTIFIISTIALAAKLSTMRQKNKLRLPVTYTEMRCISSLLPDSDQQNKPQPKRLKSFAATLEESDGDNTTLHSFLPDH